MDATSKEAAMKNKLQQFWLEMFKMGNVRGFQHFSMYLRGKEEMGLTVNHAPEVQTRRCSIPPCPTTEISAGESLTSSNLPYDKQTLVLSQGTQMTLSGLKDKGVGLPPASPSDNEQYSTGASDSTLFLVAGYSRYCCPYVWVRSNHHRLMKITGAGDDEKDNPLRLKSTMKWKDGDIHIWDIVAELVKLCMYPAPLNPFAVDMNYFLSLSTQRLLLATAAMMSCLQKIVLFTPDDKPYVGKVLEELQLVARLNFTALQTLARNRELPVFEQHQQTQQKQQSSRKHGSSVHDRTRYPNLGQPSFQRQDGCGNVGMRSTLKGPSVKQTFPGYGFTPAPSLM